MSARKSADIFYKGEYKMESENKAYWTIEYKDICDGVTFKFRKMNTIEHLNLVTKNVEFDSLDGDKAEYFISKCLGMAMWTKDGVNWNNLIDSEGNSKLQEMDLNPSIALDLFYYFKKDVLLPVFTGSKTFQKSMKEIEAEAMKD